MKKKIGTAATKIVAGRIVRMVCSNCKVKSNLSLNCGPKARSPDGSNQDVIVLVRTEDTEYVGSGQRRLNQSRDRRTRKYPVKDQLSRLGLSEQEERGTDGRDETDENKRTGERKRRPATMVLLDQWRLLGHVSGVRSLAGSCAEMLPYSCSAPYVQGWPRWVKCTSPTD